MKILKDYLMTLPAGSIKNTSKVEQLLSDCWSQLKGDRGGMADYKLYQRMEDVSWDPPALRFTIERHGGTMMGSSRAELQHWTVDIDSCEAYYTEGYRQKYKQNAPLKTKPLAEALGKLIIERRDSEKLKWDDGHICVRVRIGEIIPDGGAKQTLASRRKRFRRDLTEFLAIHGWEEVSPNYYRIGK
jgi:hypothetical protein